MTQQATDLAEAPDLMTIPEVAPFLRMHPATARAMVRKGKFPLPIIRHGQRILVSRYRLEAYLRGVS